VTWSPGDRQRWTREGESWYHWLAAISGEVPLWTTTSDYTNHVLIIYTNHILIIYTND
jgi:hypothetical protein